ncbi:MAG: hypothetical protein DRQ10_04345 [Candidatus Hydrothermota bacterium]|nr:MAG: hypothetical protein DRQ10_04345 [Candidatus Hydrothermae bacterium]
MAHAYTPGLKVTKAAIVRKERRLPLPGQVLVKEEQIIRDKEWWKKGIGWTVRAEDVVARTELPGNVQPINVAGLLSVPPEDVPRLMLKQVGDTVKRGEPIAQSKGFFGLFKTTVTAPTNGTIESVSRVTGQVILREPPIPVEVRAYIDGVVVDVIENEGVIIESKASFVQGIFGIGGERIGQIHTLVDSPDDVLTADLIDESCKDKVLVGGSFVTADALNKAVEVGAAGIVVGGIDDANLREFLGYDIGVAITGSEQKGITLIITEGFGRMRMATRTFDLLRSLEGKKASINGATQIRAGVIRPEVIVPDENLELTETEKTELKEGLVVGTFVRIIREPYFGKIGKVTALPPELQEIETEAKVRVLEVELDDGKRVIIPRANVEIIEE